MMFYRSVFRCIALLFVAACFFAGPALSQTVSKKDSDGDGVADIDDHCPEYRGEASNWGCPVHPDRDKDLIPDKDDRCPDEPGPYSTGGCPENIAYDAVFQKEMERREAEAAAKPYAPTPPADWKAKVDALRSTLMAQLETASPEEADGAVRAFGDGVRNGLFVQTGSGLDYAIEPVMRISAAGNPDLAVTIADAWNKATGYPHPAAIVFLPAADRAELQRRENALAAQKQADKEKEEARVAAAAKARLTVPLYRSEAERKAAAEKAAKEKECEWLAPKMREKGLEVGGYLAYDDKAYVLKALDCKQNEATICPAYPDRVYCTSSLVVHADMLFYSAKPVAKCNSCGGRGGTGTEETKTYKEDLPQGYFSGVQTSKTYTRTKVHTTTCSRCKGAGFIW